MERLSKISQASYNIMRIDFQKLIMKKYTFRQNIQACLAEPYNDHTIQSLIYMEHQPKPIKQVCSWLIEGCLIIDDSHEYAF